MHRSDLLLAGEHLYSPVLRLGVAMLASVHIYAEIHNTDLNLLGNTNAFSSHISGNKRAWCHLFIRERNKYKRNTIMNEIQLRAAEKDNHFRLLFSL